MTEQETIKACPWCQQKPRNSWVSDAIRMVSCGFPCCPISTVGMPLVEWNSRYAKQPEKKMVTMWQPVLHGSDEFIGIYADKNEYVPEKYDHVMGWIKHEVELNG